MNRKILVIIEHADDASIHIGGTLKKWSDNGDKITLIRVSNDDFDSLGVSTEQAIEINRQECENVYKKLGVEEIIHLGVKSDYMVNANYSYIRERIVWHIRKIRPDILVSRDIDSIDEDNMDHIIVSRAAAEAKWIAGFDIHHIEHFEKGVKPYIVPKILYFMRNPHKSNIYVDITDYIDAKIAALQEHKLVMKNYMHQIMLECKSAGTGYGWYDKYPTEVLVDKVFRADAMNNGLICGYKYAECLRNPKPIPTPWNEILE